MNINRFSIASIVILTLLILGPLYHYGYVLALDHFMVPIGRLSGIAPRTRISQIFVVFTSAIGNHHSLIPYFEKVFFIITFLFLGVIGRLLSDRGSRGGLRGIILMMCNPFLYARWMDGQANVYRLAIILPLLWLMCHRFFSNTSWKNGIGIVLVTMLGVTITPHASMMMAVVIAMFVIIHSSIKFFALWKIGKIGLFRCVGLLPWVLSMWLGSNVTMSKIDTFDDRHLAAFQTVGKPLNVYVAVASLQGYRGEGRGRFVPASGPWSPDIALLFWCMMISIVIGGMLSAYRHGRKKSDSYFVWSICCGVVLSLGVGGHNIFADFNYRLFHHLPGYMGMRDSTKRLILILMGYVWFGSKGITALYQLLSHRRLRLGQIFLSFLVVLPLIATPMMLWGGRGQLSAYDYPLSRYQLRDQRISSPPSGQIMILPWRSYLFQRPRNTTSPNPFPFFVRPTVVYSADNYEIDDIYGTSADPLQLWMQSQLQSAVFSPQADRYEGLRRYDIRTILLLKQGNRGQYERLENLTGMVVSENNADYILYQVR